MHHRANSFLCWMAALFFTLPLSAIGQTLTIGNDIQTYSTLTNTTVTMTGRSELRITGTGVPISGCTIHLNSPDSWLILTSIKPSAVSNTAYLGQIRVSGAAAALNTNCRIVQYGDGAVVIPHSSTFAPLQVFTGKYFTGSSMSLAQYTAYNHTSLGAFNDKIRSFKLKRGYTATIAQKPDGHRHQQELRRPRWGHRGCGATGGTGQLGELRASVSMALDEQEGHRRQY